MNRGCNRIANENAKTLNQLEEEIAIEWYGIPFNELDEDERGEVSFEAHDRKS